MLRYFQLPVLEDNGVGIYHRQERRGGSEERQRRTGPEVQQEEQRNSGLHQENKQHVDVYGPGHGPSEAVHRQIPGNI